LSPNRSAALNRVETRLKLPPDQVDMLIAAGRDALNANSKFRAFLGSFGNGKPPASRLALPPPVGASFCIADDRLIHGISEIAIYRSIAEVVAG
jgi:hypothetical protein